SCLPFLQRELMLLRDARVIVSLGGWSWDGVLRALAARGVVVRPKPSFGHGVETRLGAWTLLGCYHPSQQNTFTGRLTPSMLESVLCRARELAGLGVVG
ncbi:MAG: uracil-DNA glycosylase, partial [Chloroflexota bacterium]